MQNRRNWIKSSLALGGVLVSPSNFLTSEENELFRSMSKKYHDSYNSNIIKTVFSFYMKS